MDIWAFSVGSNRTGSNEISLGRLGKELGHPSSYTTSKKPFRTFSETQQVIWSPDSNFAI